MIHNKLVGADQVVQEKNSKEAILQSLKKFQDDDLNTKGGNVWAYVYDSGLREVETIAMEAYKMRSEEHTSELQSRGHLVCRLLLEKKKKFTDHITSLY